MKKALVLALAVWMTTLSDAAAAENQPYMAGTLDWNHDKNMAVSLEWDFHQYRDTDFFDFWGVDSEASNRFLPSRMGYELKFSSYFALELDVGYSYLDDESFEYPQENDTVSLEMDTAHIQFSVKRYVPVNDLIYLFGGFGADLVYIDAALDYQGDDSTYLQESAYTMYGGHILVGAECRIGKKPSPFGIDLSFRYTLLDTATLDRELVNAINSDGDTDFSSSDLDLGGFTVSTGIKYHF